jgi:hypothetical protein
MTNETVIKLDEVPVDVNKGDCFVWITIGPMGRIENPETYRLGVTEKVARQIEQGIAVALAQGNQ